MTAARLRSAAAVLREEGPAFRCACEDDGETFTDHWFDRSICPEPCGTMHDVCVECGYPKGGCMVATAAAQPTERDLALADWLEAEADEIPPHANMYRDGPLSEAPCVRVADAVLGDKGAAV